METTLMKRILLKNSNRYHFFIIVIILFFTGCKKHNEERTKHDFEVKNVKMPLKIANGGSVDIRLLKISYDSNSCFINNLKSGQTVYKIIDVNYPFMSLGFTIEYVNGKTIVHKPDEWSIVKDQELQIVIEDDGKMYFR